MNIKLVFLVSFISFLIFSTIGCITERTPDGDVILNEEHQSQSFTANTINEHVWWKVDDVTVETDIEPWELGEWTAEYFLNWTDLPPGTYVLSAHTSEEIVEWTVIVEPYQEYIAKQESLQEENFSWNNTRSEWKNRSDKLMNGEEI